MQSSWLQRFTRMMEWDAVARACLAFPWLIGLYSLYLVWAVVIRHVDGATGLIDEAVYLYFIDVVVASMAGALLLLGAGLGLRRVNPDAVWFQHISANYYGLALVIGGYLTGGLTMATGAVLMGAPIVGFLMLERRVVLVAVGIAFLAVLALNLATAHGHIPYAPLLRAPVDERSAIIWTASQFAFLAPFLLSSMIQVAVLVGHWRVREANALRLSLTDMLTGVHNRRSILELLGRELARAQRQPQGLCVVLLDLDHFKQINDRFGHPVGDRVLAEAARVIAASIRPEDALGRFGGEEFLLVLPDTTPAHAAQVVARCREQLAALAITAAQGEPVPVRASFGLAWTEPGETAGANTLIQAADTALYAAKAGGRDRLVQATAPCTGHAGASVRYPQRSHWRDLRSADAISRFIAGVLEWKPVERACLIVGILMFMGFNYWGFLFHLTQRADAATVVDLTLVDGLLRLMPALLLANVLMLSMGLRLRHHAPDALWFQYLVMGFFGAVLVGVGYTLGILYMPTGVMLLCSALMGFILFEQRVVTHVFLASLAAVVVLAFASALGLLPYAPMISVHGTAWQLATPFWVYSVYFFATWAMAIALLITDRVLGGWRAREAEVQMLSLTDALTGVGNRRRVLELFEADLKRAQRRGTPLAVVLLDLDHFKRINDTWGHPVGDRVLQAAAQVLTATLRQGDTIGRYGGEEFMLLLRDATREGARALIERCREALEAIQVYADNGERVPVSASFGFIYITHRNAQAMEPLIRAADNALYRAKAAGRNRVEVAEGMEVA